MVLTVNMQKLILCCLVVAVQCRHRIQDKYNSIWERAAPVLDYGAPGGKFEQLERELELLSEQPYFGRVNNVTVAVRGETAYLPCRVKYIQDGYMVTWLRTSDSTVLSVGADTFSSDTRLSVVHVHRPQINADDWTLIIAKTGLLDGGRYECSVNTLPKISHTVELRVEEAEERDLELALADSPVLETWDPLERLEARIQGPRTQYVSEGSTVALQCSIPHVARPPHSLYWTRDGRVFTAKDRPGISLESEKVVSVSTSKLFISHVKMTDSANYTCVSDIAKPDSVQLVVTQALPGYALMFHNSGSGHFRSPGTYLAVIFLSCLCFLSRV